MLHFFLEGGPMMFPLLLCSIAALYVIFWKAWALLRCGLVSPVYYERIQNLLLTQGRDKTIQDLRAGHAPGDVLVATVLSTIELPREEVQEHVQAAQHQVMVDLEKGLGFLHSLISIAPMIGLLGTVLGLMDIFRSIAGAATGDVTGMYAGISVALINTVSGLAVAIPCAFFYQFFSQRVDQLTAKISTQLMALLAFCRQHAR